MFHSHSRYNCGSADLVFEQGRHVARRSDGLRCMVVVDPATRKLLIPCEHVYLTRAQQRTTIPSLCQLFLQNRCRYGSQCHQLHADPSIVDELRMRVDSLPCCCPLHGDKDHAGILNKQSSLSNVVLHIPDVSYEGGYIPLNRVSYTTSLYRLLRERSTGFVGRDKDNNSNSNEVRDVPNEHHGDNDGGAASEAESTPMVLDACDQVICRLHILDRCRYAEDCRFLHICKEITVPFRFAHQENVDTLNASYTSINNIENSTFNNYNNGNHAFVSNGGGVTFPHGSRQQKLRGYPLMQSMYDGDCSQSQKLWSAPFDAPLPPSNSSSWTSHPTTSQNNNGRYSAVQSMPPCPQLLHPVAPFSLESSLTAPPMEGMSQGASVPESMRYMTRTGADRFLLSLCSPTTVPPLPYNAIPTSPSIHRVSYVATIPLSSSDSDADADVDKFCRRESSPVPSQEFAKSCPSVMATVSSGYRRSWQHNPYRTNRTNQQPASLPG